MIANNASVINIKPVRDDIRNIILISGVFWWIILAALSRVDISELQISWSSRAIVSIFIYIPLCIVVGGKFAMILGGKRIIFEENNENISFPITAIIFYALVIFFLAQCIVNTPPALSISPNNYRLEWGIKYIHVLTEIVIRVMCLLVIGNVCAKKDFSLRDHGIIVISIIYTLLVVSRSFLLEVLFYYGIASIVSSVRPKNNNKYFLKLIILFLLIVCVFIAYGSWRQGAEFSISEYAEIYIDSETVGWIFGYFLVNFDNLALLINEEFQNKAFTNTFGSLLQTLQIMKFYNVDDYLYVGKFNLGTALRPMIIDYGVWIGGLVFMFMWSLVMLAPSFCKNAVTRNAIIVLITYYTFCLPIASRLEEPPYLFAMIWILFADRCSLISKSNAFSANIVTNHQAGEL